MVARYAIGVASLACLVVAAEACDAVRGILVAISAIAGAMIGILALSDAMERDP